jgi:hypothetical protein
MAKEFQAPSATYLAAVLLHHNPVDYATCFLTYGIRLASFHCRISDTPTRHGGWRTEAIVERCSDDHDAALPCAYPSSRE